MSSIDRKVSNDASASTPMRRKSNPISPTGLPRSPGRAPSGNDGLSEAKMLVQSILNQVMFNDSPPINDLITSGNSGASSEGASLFMSAGSSKDLSSPAATKSGIPRDRSSKMNHASQKFSRQQHIQVLPTINSPRVGQPLDTPRARPSPTAAEVGDSLPFITTPSFANSHISHELSQNSTFSFDQSSLPSSVSINAPPKNEVLPLPPPTVERVPGRGAEIIMGNLSLAALCSRTIDSLKDCNVDMPPIERINSDIFVRVDSTENMTTWQREVEMAPTFASEDKKDSSSSRTFYNNNVQGGEKIGSETRKQFLSKHFDEYPNDEKDGVNHDFDDYSVSSDEKQLFPDAISTVDELEKYDSVINSVMEDDDDDVVFIYNSIPSHSRDDGVVLSSVAEENEMDDGQMQSNNTITNNLNSQSTHHNGGPSARSPVESTAQDNTASLPISTGEEAKFGAPNSTLQQKPRMQMFGSEYARHLSSESPFSPTLFHVKSRSFTKKMMPKKKRSSSSSAAATLVGSGSPVSPTATENGAMNNVTGSHKEGFESGNVSVSTLSNTSLKTTGSASACMNLEDVPPDILSAAITDIVVTHGSECPPKGYYRISQTSSGIDMDSLKSINIGGIGKRKKSAVYLNVKKEHKWDRAVQRPCVTALTVIFPDRNEFVPPGFCVVRRYRATQGAEKKMLKDSEKNDDSFPKDGESGSSHPANLNYGTPGDRVYLCYRRSREGNPITGLIPLQPSNNEAVPEGYTVLERSPRNFVADINANAGPSIFLAFRQRLANLETLRPLPLVLSVHYSNIQRKVEPGKKKRLRLNAYYCTGGTVVPSDVGKYHTMDRSTHPLISPSSVTNRLSLIQAARIKNSSSNIGKESASQGTKTQDQSSSSIILAKGLVSDAVTTSVESPSSEASLQYSNSFRSEEKSVGNGNEEEDSLMSSVGIPTEKESFVNNILHIVNQISSYGGKKVSDEENSKNLHGIKIKSGPRGLEEKRCEQDGDSISLASTSKSSFFSLREDTDIEACFGAMAFIPPIESPLHTLGKVEKKSIERLLQARTAVITPILTACYTHHGGSSLVAVEGLTKLLNETDFFLPDVALYDDPNTNQRLTILDLAIQVVCDVANSSARETSFLPCIEFVVDAVHFARGNLNSRTIGYIIRFYLFIFYFGASVPTASSWPKNKTSGYSRKDGLDEANDICLLSEDDLDVRSDGRRRGYVPGGAPQAAALALKEFISLFLTRLRKMNYGGRKKDEPSSAMVGMDKFIKNYLESLADVAMHQVDVFNFTELALHQIHRSGGSELFWHDMMNACGAGLFGADDGMVKAAKAFFITSFSLLSSIVKVTSGKVRKLAQSPEFVPRDIASKLLSLELMHHFVQQWGKACKYSNALQSKANKQGLKLKESLSMASMAYTIRRLIIPCLLSNTRAGLDDIKVFRRMMKIVTELWCNHLLRRHLKIEIGVLIEHFILKFLRLGPQVLPPKRLSKTQSSVLNDMVVSLLPQQVCIVTELKTWFLSEPRDVLELYMNFDQVDAQTRKTNFSLLPSSHWKITQQMCGALCILTEQCTDIVSDQIRLTRIDLAEVDSQSAGANPSLHHTDDDLREMTLVREGARHLQEKCFDTIGQIVRSLMLCAAASSGANFNLLCKLREKQEQDNATKLAQMNGAKITEDNNGDDDSSRESDDNMTVKSVSTIGNIVGGILSKKRDGSLTGDVSTVPESPRQFRQVPQLTIGDDNGEGIVEYWQTSIAAERRKKVLPSPRDAQDGTYAQRKPPRKGRSNIRSIPPSTPPRLLAGVGPLGVSPITALTPRRDDMSVISFADESARGDPHLNQKFEETLQTAFDIMQTKSLKKALDYLIACNFLTPSPRDIASFLRLYQIRIDTSALGDYLGEGGTDGDEVERYNLIRFHYTSAISFVGMNVEQGLRHFLTNCGFRLPGEAQKIDRIMTTFSQCYWEDNAGDHERCPFQDQDTVFLIAFAIIMLNTDLHKTSMFAAPPGQTVSKQKQRKKMTKQEFLNNLRGVDNSEDLSREYLSEIYDSIAQNPIAIYRPPENSAFSDYALGKRTIKFSSGEFGHIVQGNMDLAGMIKHFIKSVKPCQELLRGLASHEHPYLTLRNRRGKKKKSRKHLVPEELVRSAFCSLWHHFHGTINSVLDAAHLDPKGLENCLDVLMYSLCTTICLDLTVERNAFASQLVRVKFFRENRGLEEDEISVQGTVSRVRDHLDYKNDSWYMRIEKAAESYHENAKVSALDEVDGMFKKLHASLKIDSTLKKEMAKVAKRIRNGQILLNDPTRYFLKEGLLKKKCNRSGRNIEYTFFLFSDVLVYADKTSGLYKIHGELPLHLMKIMDLNSTKHKKSFHLIHPRKSFVVSASCVEDKLTWLTTIHAAIGREVKRKAN
eukprot:CAMPEP_0176485444 /NCGR_PEP_ID=MMETSP0200_2-20121128/5040_1 /TAXON_ID=947934 /ORGANISM="Chaetoceros sp., Strain GSL56" /LENGTH=2385 /DNA_ID=CAMNT_0017882083 /DNA_START=272 /DNA_END=7429 /DNA_ORIENTATION=+